MSPDAGGTRLDATLDSHIRRRKLHNKFRKLTITPRSMVDFSSNGYLSLSSNLEVQRAYLSRLQDEIAAAERIQTSSTTPSNLLGSGGSRLLDGNSAFAEALERRIAAFHGAPAALLFVSAFDANVGLLSCVPQPGDVVMYDELIHASVHDGMGLSRAAYRNGYIILDEAHSMGIFGDGGRGLVCELGLEDRVWARVLGFGKAMGCAGGVVLCSETTRSYLINYARTLIYTTSTPFTSLLSIDVVYDYIASAKADAYRNHLESLIGYAHRSLLELCSRDVPSTTRDLIYVRKRPPRSPIIPVLTAYPRSLATYCQERGFMIRPIVPPTVPVGSERVRICLHAGNTIVQVKGLCKTINQWLQHQEILRGDEQEPREIQVHQMPRTQGPVMKKAKL
ncbi:hypothetical protein DL764_000160 [Monosporascus ibericus]|uniref:Aminotransferase class I/classII large domain-containing protein n=1 Tax=Monosporascus ibericus TaxID=155417 RepID=A0A4Q4TX45_9PEZI|nr:hypothetical protein DL764_000160 [Monosporascus ibericus]